MLQIEEMERASGQASARATEKAGEAYVLQHSAAMARLTRDTMEQDPSRHDMSAYLAACAEHYALLQRHEPLSQESSKARLLADALRDLTRTWHMAIPGRGIGSVAWFFVRSHSVQDGKPAAYDPFWVEELIADEHGNFPSWREWHAAWASGDGGRRAIAPYIDVPRPFGQESEAERMACAECGASGYVIGCKDVIVISGKEEFWPKQLLCVLCPSLAHLQVLARRRDKHVVRLHPPFTPGAP